MEENTFDLFDVPESAHVDFLLKKLIEDFCRRYKTIVTTYPQTGVGDTASVEAFLNHTVFTCIGIRMSRGHARGPARAKAEALKRGGKNGCPHKNLRPTTYEEKFVDRIPGPGDKVWVRTHKCLDCGMWLYD